MTIAERLRAAAQHLREGGHVKGAYYTEHIGRGHCALGALLCVVNGQAGCWSAMGVIMEHINDDVKALALALNLPTTCEDPTCLHEPGEHVVDWNDAPDQTAENVIAGLELAALVWEEQQKTIAQEALVTLEQETPNGNGN